MDYNPLFRYIRTSFLSAVLYFYCSMKDEKKGYASWIGIVIAASLGIKIKPTVVIALLAIVLAEIFFAKVPN